MADRDEGGRLEREPTELGETKAVLKAFCERAEEIEREISTLKEDLKDLVDEYADRIDVKTLRAALRVIKIEAKVAHRDTYDRYVEVLRDPAA